MFSKLNPLTKKELISLSRSYRIPGVVLIINIILGIIAFYSLIIPYIDLEDLDEIWMSELMTIGWIIILVEIAFVMIYVCMFTATSLAEEKDKQTYEMLVTTDYSLNKMIFGKILAGCIVGGVVMISTLPMVFIIGPNMHTSFKNIFVLIITSLIGCVMSGYLGATIGSKGKNMKSATFSSLATWLILVAGTLIIVMVIWYFKDLSVNSDYYNLSVGEYQDVNPGVIKYILICNPLMTVAAVVLNIIGSNSVYLYYFDNVFVCSNSFDWFILENWIVISSVIQIGLCVGMYFIAGKLYDPLFQMKRIFKK